MERLTGQTVAEEVPVEVNLVMTDQALFNTDTPSDGDADNRSDADTGSEVDTRSGAGGAGTGEAGAGEPATMIGYGPIPAELARRIAQQAAQADQLWVRRLYTDPETGQLVAMDSRSRFFPAGLAKFLICGTRCVEPRGAMHRSGTATTSPPSNITGRRPRATVRGCAWPATTPNRHPGGPAVPDRRVLGSR